jgi:7-cyano-7-deazaguanine synthase in queuosine biosynthesis
LCDSCRLRREGFVSAGLSDPTPYAQGGAKIV